MSGSRAQEKEEEVVAEGWGGTGEGGEEAAIAVARKGPSAAQERVIIQFTPSRGLDLAGRFHPA